MAFEEHPEFNNEIRMKAVTELLKFYDVKDSSITVAQKQFNSTIVKNFAWSPNPESPNVFALFSPEIKKAFESFSKKTFCFAPGREAYIYLCPMIDDTNSTHIIYGRQFSANQINPWIEQHKQSLITIEGQYCDRYDITEHFTIESFTSDLFLRHENSSTRALQQISKGITCRNDLHRPIQELVDNISKSIDIIQKKMSNS